MRCIHSVIRWWDACTWCQCVTDREGGRKTDRECISVLLFWERGVTYARKSAKASPRPFSDASPHKSMSSQTNVSPAGPNKKNPTKRHSYSCHFMHTADKFSIFGIFQLSAVLSLRQSNLHFLHMNNISGKKKNCSWIHLAVHFLFTSGSTENKVTWSFPWHRRKKKILPENDLSYIAVDLVQLLWHLQPRGFHLSRLMWNLMWISFYTIYRLKHTKYLALVQYHLCDQHSNTKKSTILF